MLNSVIGELSLKGKIVLVTGSNRGIGRAIVEKCVNNGAIVYANAKRTGSLDTLIDTCENPGSIIPLYFDVTDRAAVRNAFIHIKKDAGRLDCLVNNAGILVDTTLPMLNSETLRRIFEVNVFAVFDFMSYASRMMMLQKSGSIVNISSICGDEGGMRGQTAYSSSKGAVIALTKTAAKELGSNNIRVNSIAPGFIDTDMFRSGPVDIQEKLINGVYLNSRVGLADEVAELAIFLLSDKSSYITGESIRIDGFSHI
jgi:3-oxoacyl-[acyl-carrier protein] reductase